jgi:guanylate kinase
MDNSIDTHLVRKLATYTPAPATAKLVKETPILLLVGPTGAGKDSLKDKLLKTGHYHHIISHTTRPPRINHGILEEDGREYHFIGKQTAEKMLDDQAMIEAKIYSGNLYGTSVSEIQAAKNENKTAMTDIEVQGVAEYKSLDPSVMAVFMLPPDFETWQERLSRRYGDVVDVEDFRMRLQTALSELDQLLITDYYIPVVNNDLDVAFKKVQDISDGKPLDEVEVKKAHDVAQKLARDIQKHLDENATAA